MAAPQLLLYVGTKLEYAGDLTLPTELGREADDDQTVYAPQKRDGSIRVAIANKEVTGISRQLLLLTPVAARVVRVKNLGKQVIQVANQEPLRPAQDREVNLPAELMVFDRRVLMRPSDLVETVELVSLNRPVEPPGSGRSSFPEEINPKILLADKLNAHERDQLERWLGGVTSVLQSAISSADFSERAAQEMVKLIGLDSGRVIDFCDDGEWKVVAAYEPRSDKDSYRPWVPIRELLRRVCDEKKTCWTSPTDLAVGTSSRVGLKSAIAAPLLDGKGNVIGALYGDKRKKDTFTGELIGNLEAMLVETLARGVAAGRARVDQERAVAAAQVRFEQFFTPELSRQLASNPDLLTRRDTEITVLFCDIRRFSAISEDGSAEITMQWLSDVMSQMADCAAAYDGALIDYIGDELMIMWGAPTDQPDHATRACQAALAMARQTIELNRKWEEKLGHSTKFGIGINTGSARVGNVGFARKFRYAPFGTTVNLASRVQGATKHLGAGVVITEATYRQLRTKPLARPLCTVRVVNIERPVLLYELCDATDPEMEALCQQYQLALNSYEKEELPRAVRILSEILRVHPNDGPTLLLLSRTVDSLLHRDVPFDPVVNLIGK